MKYVVFLFLFALINHTALNASDNLPTSARSMALSNASVSLADLWSIQNNQAGLAWIKTPLTGISYENKFMMKELSTKTGSFIYPLKRNTIGASLSSFGYNVYNENNIKLAAAKAFGNNLSFGVGLNYFQTTIFEYGIKKLFIAEAGLQAKPFQHLTIGAHLFNLTRTKLADYNNERVPTTMRLGASYLFSEKAMLVIETEKSTEKKPLLKTGIEYRPIPTLYIRCGISTNPSLNSFGIGLNIKQIKIDIATNYHHLLGLSTQVGMIYEFKRTENKEK